MLCKHFEKARWPLYESCRILTWDCLISLLGYLKRVIDWSRKNLFRPLFSETKFLWKCDSFLNHCSYEQATTIHYYGIFNHKIRQTNLRLRLRIRLWRWPLSGLFPMRGWRWNLSSYNEKIDEEIVIQLSLNTDPLNWCLMWTISSLNQNVAHYWAIREMMWETKSSKIQLNIHKLWIFQKFCCFRCVYKVDGL